MRGPQPETRPELHPDPDHDLVALAAAGDQEGCRLLVERYQRRVIGLIWGLIGGEYADAEDVAQETFVRALRSLANFRRQSSFRTWLFQIAINTARTHRQQLQRRMGHTGDNEEVDLVADPHGLEAGIVARDQIRHAMTTLPAELREAVLLRDVNGLDYREIADLLGVPIGTVESRIFRGRARLKKALAPEIQSEGAR